NLNAGDNGSLVALQLRWHRGLMEDAVDTIADAQFIFGRFEVNISGAILESLPNDLVYKLDDAGFLVALGDFLVLADQQFQRFVFGKFVESFGADAVIFFEGFLDFLAGGKGKLNGSAGIELD